MSVKEGGIPIFERRIRHLQRYREIATAFTRNGFGFLVKELGLHEILTLPKRLFVKDEGNMHSKSTGERLRQFLEELGPTFVKMGQMASTRPDLIPDDIIRELEKLQDRVPRFSYQEATSIMEQELGMTTEQVFSEFDEIPIGAASIGQVHHAVLRSGESVAVKIQRPNIEGIIKTDLEILQQLAILAELRLEWASRYQIREIVEEFSKTILAELDYTIEGRNAAKMTKQFNDDPTIRIPYVYWDYTSKKVLTMEYLQGTKVNQLEELKYKGYDTKVVADRIVHAVLQQILMDGFFHGDPHPGNISVLPEETIVFMDFGMVGRLSPEIRNDFASLVIAMMRQNTDGIIKAIVRMGLIPDDVNMQHLRSDVDQLKDKYYDVPLSQVQIGEVVNDLFSIARHHRILFPSDFTLLGKALLSMEGMVEKLDPDLSIMKAAEPFGRQLLRERYHPKRVAENMVHQSMEFGEVLTDLPKNLQEITAMLKNGKLPIEISTTKLDLLIKKLDRIGNRLSFSIVLLAFSIIMVGLIMGSAIRGQSSLLWNIPAVEIGFFVATTMFLWLLYSIFKSGRF